MRSTLASAAGCTARSAGHEPVSHPRPREALVVVALVLAPLQAARLAVGGRLLARDAQQRADQPPVARRHPQQRAPARRGREPVENRLDLVARVCPVAISASRTRGDAAASS